MRSSRELHDCSTAGGVFYGYLDIEIPGIPSFVMFMNGQDCPVCTNFLIRKTFEPQSLHIWNKLGESASSIIDIGAHSGVYSLVAAAIRPDLNVIAFEPNPDNYARLLVNITANGCSNVVPSRNAIAHQSGLFEFGWVSKGLGHLSSGGRLGSYPTPKATRLFVNAIQLDEALAGLPIGTRPLIKIDVEGGEVRAFAGMPKILALKPDIILETFHSEACEQIGAQTQSLGYSYFFIDEVNRRIEQRDCLRPADPQTGNMNQLLTTRSIAEIESLLKG